MAASASVAPISQIRPASPPEPAWKTSTLEKHKKYIPAYKPRDFFWGIGIEQETYLEISGGIHVPGSLILENHRRERYAVDYFSNYKPKLLKEALSHKFKRNKTYVLPLLINAHSFLHTDKHGYHRTTYERVPRPSEKFSGTTLFEEFSKADRYFKKQLEHKYLFDGDTVEFATLKFYKATVEDSIEELEAARKEFLRRTNRVQKKIGFYPDNPIVYPQTNHPFAVYLTNKFNLGIFNNGTYNINLTIPTKLNDQAEIADWQLFKEQHRRAIRLIQWIEPLLLIAYGSPDPCASMGRPINNALFSAASQRCAVSRYIGIGTFDTNEMPRGKLLQRPASSFKVVNDNIGWYKKFYVRNAYTPQRDLGFDINFNKHKNHGIEIRFFDSFPTSQLKQLMHLLVVILDYAVRTPDVPNPIESVAWNNFTTDAMRLGKKLVITEEILSMYESVFKIHFPPIATTANDVLLMLFEQLYDPAGLCASRMIRRSFVQSLVCWS